MGIENCYEGVEEYAQWLIRKKAKELARHSNFTEDDVPDLEQELVLDLLVRLPKYDPNRAGRNTFIALVVKNKAASIIERQKSVKRKCKKMLAPLDEPIQGSDGDSISRGETISQEDYFCRTERSSRLETDRRIIPVDIERIISTLPPVLQKLCKQLQYLNVAEINRQTGIPRSTIYEKMNKLKSIFEEVGLRN